MPTRPTEVGTDHLSNQIATFAILSSNKELFEKYLPEDSTTKLSIIPIYN